MNCTDIKEQLVDFLYDELSTDARMAFTAHLHGCAACSAEVASYQAALGDARSALAGPLAQEPPSRIRLSAIAAATIAAARGEDSPSAAMKPRKQAKSGFFARLLRTPWLMPAFGAASVATAVFLVRVLKNPDVFPVPQELPTEGVAGQPATQPLAPAQEATAGKEKAPEAEKTAEPKKRDSAKKVLSAGAKTASSERFAQPPPPRTAPEPLPLVRNKRAMVLDELGAAPPPSPALNTAPAFPLQEGGGLGGLTGAVAPTNNAVPSAAKHERAPSPRSLSGSSGSSASSPFGTPSPAPAASPPRPSSRRAETEHADEAAPYPREENLVNDKASKTATRAEPTPSLAESARKADRLFANQEWNAAADAYRDLLRRFPNDKDAPRWRDRLRTATMTVQNPKSGKAKATTSDPLDGLKL